MLERSPVRAALVGDTPPSGEALKGEYSASAPVKFTDFRFFFAFSGVAEACCALEPAPPLVSANEHEGRGWAARIQQVRAGVAKVKLPGYAAEYFRVSDVMEWEPLLG